MVAKASMDVAVEGGVNQGRHGTTEAWFLKKRGESGVSAGKEVEHSIDIRGVTDIANFHIKVEKTSKSIHLYGKGRAIREMINQGVDFTEINRACKNSFHGRCVAKEDGFLSLSRFAGEKT